MEDTKKSTLSDSLATHSDFMSQGKNRPNKWIQFRSWAEARKAAIKKHAVGGRETYKVQCSLCWGTRQKREGRGEGFSWERKVIVESQKYKIPCLWNQWGKQIWKPLAFSKDESHLSTYDILSFQHRRRGKWCQERKCWRTLKDTNFRSDGSRFRLLGSFSLSFSLNFTKTHSFWLCGSQHCF